MASKQKLGCWFLIMYVILMQVCAEEKKMVHLKGNGTINFMAIASLWGENYTLNYETGIIPLVAIEYGITYRYGRFAKYPSIPLNRPDLKENAFGYQMLLKDVYYQDQNDEDDFKKMYKKVVSWRTDPYNPPWFILGPRSTSDMLALKSGRLEVNTPLFSYGASSIYLDKYTLDWNNEMLSSVASDVFRIQALIDLLEYYRWTFIGVIASPGFEGKYELDYFIKKTEHTDICVPITIDTNRFKSDEALAKGLQELAKISLIKVLVMFTNDVDSRNVLKALKLSNLGNRFTLLFLYGSLNYIEVVRGYEDIALGSLTIDQSTIDHKYFEDWFLARTPKNSETAHFHLYWEDLFKCRLRESKPLKNMKSPKRRFYANYCKGYEKLQKYHGFYPNSLARRILLLFVHATYELEEILLEKCMVECTDKTCSNWNDTCPFSVTGQNVDDFYRTLLFRKSKNRYNSVFTLYFQTYEDKRVYRKLFDWVKYSLFSFRWYDGIMQNRHVATWRFYMPDIPLTFPMTPQELLKNVRPMWYLGRTPYWKDHDGKLPQSSACNERCKSGFKREYFHVLNTSFFCKNKCWKCVRCFENNSIVLSKITCKTCQFGEIANINNTICIKIPKYVLSFEPSTNYIVLTVLCCCCLGTCFVIFTATIFKYFNESTIVNSIGKVLSYSILLVLFILFLCPFAYFSKPNNINCAFREIFPWSPLMALYGALFLKTFRTYRIMVCCRARVGRPLLSTPTARILTLVSVSIVQLLIAAMWIINDQSNLERIISKNNLYITYHCKGFRNNTKITVNLLPCFVAQTVCTVLAFITRKSKRNYNEAKYIVFTVSLTLLYWCVFLPVIIINNNANEYFTEYSISILSCTIGFTILFGIFGPKLFLLFRKMPLKPRSQTISLLYKDYHREMNMNIHVHNMNSPSRTTPQATV